MGSMGDARAGGTSGRTPSGNPPAILLSIDNGMGTRWFDHWSPEALYGARYVNMHRLGESHGRPPRAVFCTATRCLSMDGGFVMVNIV